MPDPRRVPFATLLLGATGLLLGGCHGNDIIHACPDVRHENPSLLQGRTAQAPWWESKPTPESCDAPPIKR